MNDGSLQGGASASSPGLIGQAFSFDGTNGFVQIPDSASLEPSNLTVEAWVRFSSLDSWGNSSPGDQYLIFKQNSSTNSGVFAGFALSKARGTNGDTFVFQASSPSGQTAAVRSVTLVGTGVWYHVAGVRGSNYLQLYVNGQMESQTNVSFKQDYGAWPLYFGTTGQSTWDHKFAGWLDEVSLYNRALSAGEINAIYAAGAAGKCKGVAITVQPQSQTVSVGSNATFAVGATGFGTLNYQWQFNGIALAGASGTNLSLISVQPGNAGNYTVVVSNSLGAVTSAVAVLSVLAPDLAPLTDRIPTAVTGPPYPPLTLVWGVTNQGTAPVAGGLSWSNAVYCSTNPVLDNSAIYLAGQQEIGPLPVGGSYWQTNTQNTVTLAWDSNPITNVAGYRLYQGLTNRIYTKVMDVGMALTNRISGLVGGVTYFFAVTAYDSDGLETPFSNEVSYSAPGAGLSVPLTQSGTYYLIFQTDVQNAIAELNKTNNTAVIPVTFNALQPDLAPVALLAPSSSSGPPDLEMLLVWGVTNQGSGPAEPSWCDRVYLSTNNVLGSTAVPLISSCEQGPLAPGGTYWRTNSVQLPLLESGNYYLILETDAYNQLSETDKSNNSVVAAVNFTVLPPDLAPLQFQVPNVVVTPPNPKMLLTWAVTNLGVGAAVANPFWSDRIYFSTNTQVQPWDLPLIINYESGTLAAGGSYWQTNITRVPVVRSGTYYFIFNTDADKALPESNFGNNGMVVPVAFQVNAPDLMPVQFQVPNVITGPPNPSITFSYAVTNQGVGQAIGADYWYDQVYLSTNSVLDGTEREIVPWGGWAETGPLAAGQSYYRTRTVHLPVLESGAYYLFFKVDAQDNLYESDKSNNVISVPIVVTVQRPDLAPLALIAPSPVTGPPFPNVSMAWGVTNQGIGMVASDGSWVDTVYLSRDTNLSDGDVIGVFNEVGPLLAGGSYWRTNTLRIPVVQSGSYYLIFQTDAQSALYESDKSNNVVSVPITFVINPPDLTPIRLLAPSVISGPPNPQVILSWGVTNAGSGPAVPDPSWSDQVFLSTNSILYWWDTPLFSSSESGILAPGGSYWRTNTVRVPVVQSGSYNFIFKTDANNAIYESNESNNIVVVPVTFSVNAPDLAPVSFQAPGVVNGAPNPTVTLVWGVTNQGAGPAVGQWSAWRDTVYLSSNSVRDGTELYVGQWIETNTVSPGASYWRTNTLRMPVVQSGTYYLIFETDTDNSLVEANLSNNTTAVQVSFNLKSPDLLPVVSLVTGPPATTVTLVWGVTNQGAGVAVADPPWHNNIFFSTKPQLDGSQTLLVDWLETNTIPPQGIFWRTNTVQVPALASGLFYLIFTANTYQDLYESNFNNNSLSVPINLQVQLPDLAPVAWQVPGVVMGPPWPTVSVTVGVTNLGTAPTSGSWTDAVYLSSTPFIDQGARRVASWQVSDTVPPGASYWRTNSIQVPIIDSGSAYLIFVANDGNSLRESDELNNQAVAPVTFQLSAPPDLVVSALQAPPIVSGSTNPSLTVAWQVTNQGIGPALGYWSDALYLSTNPMPGMDRLLVMSLLETNMLPAGSDYWTTNTFALPGIQSGDYYLVLIVNSQSNLFEAEWDNNAAAVRVQFDLRGSVPISIVGQQLLPDGSVRLAVQGDAGPLYSLQTSTDLANWVSLNSFYCVGLRTYVVDPHATSFGSRFYRIIAPPDSPAFR